MTKALIPLCGFTLLVTLGWCSLPEDISNFQNEYVCNNDVRLVRPLTVADVAQAVRRHARVKPTGTGHSWNNFYCAPSPSTTADPSDTSANIAMTTIRPLKIKVNEKDPSAWISAGVTVWDLMVYLGNYVTATVPRGYVLMGTPSCVNQTIGGAVATNTHGSSLKHGSLSNQLLAVKVVLANGTRVEISKESHPFLMRAFQVSAGRLGIVTDVKMKIYQETLAQRILRSAIPSDEFMAMLKNAQEMYKATGALPDWMEGTNIWWATTNSTFELYTFKPLEEVHSGTSLECSHLDCYVPTTESILFLERLKRTKINTPVNVSRSMAFSDIADGVTWETPSPFPPNPVVVDPNTTAGTQALLLGVVRREWDSAIVETHEAIYALRPAFGEDVTPTLNDDYAIGVPANKMADCLEGVKSLLESAGVDDGLRTLTLIRFVGKEDGLLSMSNNHPQLIIDVFDLLYYNRQNRSSNVPFKDLVAFLVTSPLCSPSRLHWGKSGWPDSGCWNGAQVYQDTWCDFGCAVQELDPHGKFIGVDPNLWNWNGGNLDKCCTSAGYDTSLEGCGCDVIPVRMPDACPEAPFFTNR